MRYVEPDGTVEPLGQSLPWGIDRVDADVAHAKGETGNGADIAIIDSGIDSDHPDLQANLGRGYSVETCSGCDEPWDDDHGHGTHCAGIADALDNEEGVLGMSTEATLHAVKVFTEDSYATVSGLSEGIQWVADQGYDVGSMSLGATSSYSTLRDACKYAYDRGVFLVAAAGNDGPCSDCVRYPAAYSTVVAVSATTEGDGLASFSSAGPEIELAAPGSYIYSTVPDGYASKSGTSMACPHVAGAAGQLMANGYSHSQARDRLQGTAEDIGLTDGEQGYGLLDAEAAVGDTEEDSSLAVTTAEATDIGETSATLHGSLDDLGGATDAEVSFEYRESGSTTWNSTSTQSTSTTGSFEEPVTGLTAGTDYEFRAVADASDGDTDTGSTITFATTSADTSVSVTTGDATDVGETSATLNGSLEDLGGASSTDVSFEWGAAGGSLSTTTSTETLSSTGTFEASITSLESGTDYEFRAVADASDGDADTGSTVTFSTDSSSGSTGPSVDRYDVTEAGSPNPHAEITADWGVTDADGDLDSVLVEVIDSDGVVDSSRTNVSGSSAAGTDQFKLKHAGGTTYDVRLTVSDSAGNIASQTVTVSS